MVTVEPVLSFVDVKCVPFLLYRRFHLVASSWLAWEKQACLWVQCASSNKPVKLHLWTGLFSYVAVHSFPCNLHHYFFLLSAQKSARDRQRGPADSNVSHGGAQLFSEAGQHCYIAHTWYCTTLYSMWHNCWVIFTGYNSLLVCTCHNHETGSVLSSIVFCLSTPSLISLYASIQLIMYMGKIQISIFDITPAILDPQKKFSCTYLMQSLWQSAPKWLPLASAQIAFTL